MNTNSVKTILAALIAAALGATGALGQIEWDGNGTPDAGGSWNTGVNWVGDVVPSTTNDTARLVSVTSGTRIVTLDSATTVNVTQINQTTSSGINILSLNANLTLSRANSMQDTPANSAFLVTLSGGATATNAVTNRNGYRNNIQSPNNSSSGGVFLHGTINFNAAGSSIGFYENIANWSGFTLNGTINVTADGEIAHPWTSATAGMPNTLNNGSQLNITNNSIFSIYKGAITGSRTVSISSNGTITIDPGSTLSQRVTANTTTAWGGTTFLNNGSATVRRGTVNHGGVWEMKTTAGNSTLTPPATFTNNGTWIVTGDDAGIKRLNAGNTADPRATTFTNNGVGIFRGYTGSGGTDTLEFDDLQQTSRRLQFSSIGNSTVQPGPGSSGSGLSSVAALILRDVDVTLDGFATLELDIGGTSAGQFDTLRLQTGASSPTGAGTLTLAGNAILQMFKVNSFDPGSTPFSITLIQAGSVSGTFATVKLDSDTFTANELDVGGGKKYTLTYNTDNVVLSYIPEPGTVGLMLGGFALAMIRRRLRGRLGL